ncbi:MAG: M48 family metalloprotease [Reichenbachiella sp.]
MKFNRSIVFLLFLVIFFGEALGQSIYQPKDHYDAQSQGLVERIRAEGRKYSDPLPKNHGVIKDVIDESVEWHVEQISNGKFIKDPVWEKYINGIVDKIVNTTGVARPFKVFIVKNPSINAFCTPIGSLIINNGLLSRLNSEEQLTFVLAHEIAHWELEHIKRQIVNQMNTEGGKGAKKEVKKLSSGRISVQGIREIRRYMERISKFSRDMELEADSMAFLIYTKLRYDSHLAIETMDMLDSNYLYSPYYGSKLFKALDFEKFPFNTKWVTDDSNREFRIAAARVGPLSTHPELPVRKERLLNKIESSSSFFIDAPSAQFDKVKREAAMEDIICAYEIDYYLDQSLYYALRLYNEDKTNSFVNEMITKILYRVSELKENGMFLVRSEIERTNKELYYVNTFLNNITDNEALDLAFYFLNHKGNFDKRNEEHFMVLYEICGATNRFKMQEMVKNGYRATFPKGKYLLRMY